MDPFNHYLQEHNLPLVFDDDEFYTNSDYQVGDAYVDEFDDYKPIFELMGYINERFPDVVESIETLTTQELEFAPDNREIDVQMFDEEIYISAINRYQQKTVAKKGEQVFTCSSDIRYNDGTHAEGKLSEAKKKIVNWFEDSEQNHQAIRTLLQENETECADMLHSNGFEVSSEPEPIDYAYRRVGNAGGLRDLVETANLGKTLRRPEYDGIITLTPDGWLIDCLDYEKDGKRYIRTEIFGEAPDEQNRNKETAVSFRPEAHHIIPAETFVDDARTLLRNFRQFNEISYAQNEQLNENFQALDDVALITAVEELTSEEPTLSK
mgnify:CR=1 FL=1